MSPDRRFAPAADERGFALVTVLMLAGLVAAMLSAHFILTRVERATSKSSLDGSRGFYAAEAGVNVRAEQIRNTFLGYNRPAGTTPVPIPGQLPCDTGTLGSGAFACQSHTVQGRDVRSYVEEDPSNPGTVVIPPGEDFQGLTAQEYTYAVSSFAVGDDDRPEAILDMRFRSRLIPLFQFAAFYDKDLEILPGPAMTFEGPVHTNGNLFLDAATSLTIDGQVTTVGRLFRGRKENSNCSTGTVSVHDLSGPLATQACGGNRYELVEADVDGTNPPNLDWQGLIHVGATYVDVPPPEALDPVPGATYWDLADLRVMLDLVDAAAPIKVYNPDGTVDWSNTNDLTSGCPSAVWSTSGDLYNWRESANIEMLEVDVQEVMDCIEGSVPNLMGGRALDDGTEGGLVWYLGVDDGVNAAAPNNYGVRVQGGAMLGPTSGLIDIQGLTVVTNQALYVQGDYNEDPGADWRPSAFLADSLNVLSNAWDDINSPNGLGTRNASTTTIRAAFLSGTDTSGGPTGEGGLNTGNYNGGLENYPRFHEDWGGVTLTYRGSFVSLNRPLRVDGEWGDQSYSPPVRDWGYDTQFNNAANLPPLSPRFVYLKHELFVREFAY